MEVNTNTHAHTQTHRHIHMYACLAGTPLTTSSSVYCCAMKIRNEKFIRRIKRSAIESHLCYLFLIHDTPPPPLPPPRYIASELLFMFLRANKLPQIHLLCATLCISFAYGALFRLKKLAEKHNKNRKNIMQYLMHYNTIKCSVKHCCALL